MMKIMIADDSGTARMFIRQCVEITVEEDVEFLEAENGKQALDKLKECGGVDLLITDLNMPVLDGRELIRRVSASPRLNGMPIMVVTSSGNQARREELLEMGACVVLRKPVNPMTIAEGFEAIQAREET